MPTLTQFFPTSWDDRSIVRPLDATISRAHRLYGAVAYWTIGPEVLHARLVELLRQPESFCCVDLHLPTDVDKLNEFVRLGANQLYLQCHEVRQRGERHLHRHLLHTKLLLFDLPRGQAEVWVGSYNFTKQALLGANREASMVLATPQGSALYQQVRAYLEAIRSDVHCHRFDPDRLDDYKKLQGLPDDEPEPECFVLPVAWHSDRMATLTRQTLLLLGHNADERRLLAQADATNAPVVLRAYDLSTGLTTHYGVVIQNQGAIDRVVPSSYDLAFGQRHLAVRPPDTLPYVAPQENPLPPAELREFGFWASLLVLDQLPVALRLLPRERADQATWQRDWVATQELRDQLHPTDEDGRQLVFAYDTRPSVPAPLREAIPELSAEQWLSWAMETSVRYRGKAKLGQVGVFGATFQDEVLLEDQTPLDALDRQFSLYNRQYLQTAYEQPLRQRYYENSADGQDFRLADSAAVPRLRKLLEKYRMQY
jgi:hypothetical protein